MADYGRGQQRYERQLKDQRDNTLEGPHDKNYVDEQGIGGTHFEHWRDTYKCDAIHLYCKNALTVEQVILVAGDSTQPNGGIAPKYHIMALDNCVDDKAFWALSQDMVAHGIDVFKLDATRNRMAGKREAETKRVAIKASCAPTIIRDGKVEYVRVVAKPLTAKELAVQEALLRAGRRERLLKEIAKLKAQKAKAGMTVTESLQAEILARHAKKDIVIK